MTTRPFEARFWEKVQKTSGCWLWLAGTQGHGYGSFWRPPRQERAHRVAWELANGPIPPGLWVLHECDNPPCVRPSHLFLGTPAMNSADAARKGRMRAPRGEDHPNAKLTTADVAAIRARLSDGESQRSIGRAFGVGHQYVGDIGAGRFWAHTKGSDYESIERRT